MLKKKLIDLGAQRTLALNKAQTALESGDNEQYETHMTEVRNLGAEMEKIQDVIKEQERSFTAATETPAEARDRAEELGNQLMRGESVRFTARDVSRSAFTNSVTLATGTLAAPTGVGTDIRDPLNAPGSIIDQVSVIDLTGLESYSEPYVITELDAKGGKVTTNAGKARQDSTDPTFGVAKIKPYEGNVTAYVDRNINRLTPEQYYNKIASMAMKALRRLAISLILNGDGQATPDMYGIKTATNTAGDAIYATESLGDIDVGTLDSLVYAYGGDDMVAGSARLLLTKADLQAIGALRGTNEKRRLFTVTPDGANPNTGIITDGGLTIPYTLCSALTAHNGAAADALTMCYGNPLNYELGLFGDYSIRVDESIKGIERMYTILGDVMLGGNLVVDKGFVVAKHS